MKFYALFLLYEPPSARRHHEVSSSPLTIVYRCTRWLDTLVLGYVRAAYLAA